jgi:membrane-bound metal-dependent hydrolase YbcI (DUF457 family)
MPSPVGHVIAGVAAGVLVNRRSPLAAMVVFGAAAAAPDLDLIAGVHRGASHSAGAALLAGAAGWILWRLTPSLRARGPAWRFALAVAAAYATHIVTDMVSDDSRPPIGCMALWPFTDAYYQGPFILFLPVSRAYWRLRAWTENAKAVALEIAVLGPMLWASLRTRNQ